jgi:CrcB protein
MFNEVYNGKVKPFTLSLKAIITALHSNKSAMKDIFINIMLVALGGGAGSICRYLLTLIAARFAAGPFPFATLAANIAGSLLIGILAGMSVRFAWPGPQLRLLLMSGFCGGFTTFSAFSLEIVHLAQQNRWGIIAAYALGSIILGIAAAMLGYRILN